MNCETCHKKDFVHAGLYCQGCPDRPKPKMKTGTAYLYMKNRFKPITSVSVEAPEGSVSDAIALKLDEILIIEFIESDRL